MILRKYQKHLVEGIESTILHSCAVWARRTGKTFTLAYGAFSWQLDNKKSNIAIVSPYKNLADVTRDYIQEWSPDFRGLFCTTPSQLRGKPVDVVYIDEADWVQEDMIKVINNMIEGNPYLPIRAYGTKNRSRKDGEHFWQTLDLGPQVSVFYCGAEVLPHWDSIKNIKDDYFDEEDYKAEILSRP